MGAREAGVGDFRYTYSWVFWAGMPVVLAAMSVCAAVLWRWSERFEALGYLAFALCWAACWAYSILQSRRAYIRLGEAGIVIRRPLGPDRGYTWDQVRDVLFPYRPLGMPLLLKPLARVRVNGAKLDLAYYTDQEAEAAQAIIARAGLTQQRRTWQGTMHERPESTQTGSQREPQL